MDINNQYNELVNTFGSKIKKFGYKKVHSNFYIQEDGNWGIINFQKSTKSSSKTIFFTINLGIASSRILRFFGMEKPNNKPNFQVCQWQERIGHIISRKDLWWTIETHKPIDLLIDEIWIIMHNFGIPEISKFIHDTDLRNLWLSGLSPSLTEFQRLQYLSVLLSEIGPNELLKPTLQKLQQISKGKPMALPAEIFIKKILTT